MQRKRMDGDLLQLITTVSKKAECLDQIDILLNRLTAKDSEELSDLGDYINKLQSTSDDKERFLQDLATQVRDLPVYRVTIAFEPNKKHIDQLSQMIKQLHGPQTVMDLYVDPLLGAGATIEFCGKYYDGSAVKMLSQTQ